MMKTIDFMSMRKMAAIASVVIVLGAIASLVTKGLNLGLDFTEGTALEVEYSQPIELQPVRELLEESGFVNVVVQHYGNISEVLVNIPPQDHIENMSDTGQLAFEVLQSADSSVIKKRVEFVGPSLGAELRDKGGIAMMVALGCMLLYVSFRFRFKFALGAVVALFHDVLITLGLFSLFQLSFDQTVLAALLAVIGYSLNDTIVVSDRIRENFRQMRETSPSEIINDALNKTIGRTLVTSITTLLVLVALLFLGGELIKGFAIALIIGVLVGTYSSLFVVTNILLLMNISKEDFIELVSEEDEEGLEELP